MSESNRPVIRYKPGYALAQRTAIRLAKVGAMKPRVPKPPRIWKRRGYVAEDTSPPIIQRLRKALCDEFVATGVMNEELMAKLRVYAESKREGRVDARRRSKNDPVGVQAKPSPAVFTQRDDL